MLQLIALSRHTWGSQQNTLQHSLYVHLTSPLVTLAIYTAVYATYSCVYADVNNCD